MASCGQGGKIERSTDMIVRAVTGSVDSKATASASKLSALWMLPDIHGMPQGQSHFAAVDVLKHLLHLTALGLNVYSLDLVLYPVHIWDTI